MTNTKKLLPITIHLNYLVCEGWFGIDDIQREMSNRLETLLSDLADRDGVTISFDTVNYHTAMAVDDANHDYDDSHEIEWYSNAIEVAGIQLTSEMKFTPDMDWLDS